MGAILMPLRMVAFWRFPWGSDANATGGCMQILRNLVIVAILFIVIGGFLIVAEVPSLPTWAQQLDATIGLSHSGRLARAGFAKSTAQVGMFFYDPKKDEYKWGLNGHFENLPIRSRYTCRQVDRSPHIHMYQRSEHTFQLAQSIRSGARGERV
jgi:hypothetical protein